MVATTPVEDERQALESQLREAFGRVAYTNKTHEKMAERRSGVNQRIKIAQIVLSALTAGGAFGVLFDQDSVVFRVGTAVLAISLLVLNSYLKDLDPGAEAQKHRETASSLWDVRESYLSLLADVRDKSIALDKLRERRDRLQRDLAKIYKLAPQTDADAYAKAQQALKVDEELTFSDRELDVMLPSELRKRR